MSNVGLGPFALETVKKLIAAAVSGVGGAVTWDDVQDKPSTFPPVIGTEATQAMAGDTIIPSPATEGTPAAPGTASNGSATSYARSDHVHARQTAAQTLMTGYVAGSAGNVAAGDAVTAAIAKLEARIAALESAP